MSSVTLLLCLATASTAAIGADIPPDETVVVTASPLADPAGRVAQGAAVVLRDEIIARVGAQGLGEAVAGIPGVRSTYFGPNASRPVLRGLGEDRVRILLDGLQGIDASTISPDHAPTAEGLEAEAIEVLKGPAVLRYGGNAVGGVVNVVSGRIPSEAPSRPVSGELAMGGASVDASEFAALALQLASGGFVLRLDGLARSNQDYAIPGTAESARQLAAEGEDPAEAGRGIVENSGGSLSVFGVGAGWIGTGLQAGLALRVTSSDYGVPGHDHEDDHSHGGPVAMTTAAAEEEEGVRIELEQTRVDGRIEATDLGFVDSLLLAATWGDYTHSEIEPDGALGTRFDNQGHEVRLEARHRAVDIGDMTLTGMAGASTVHQDFSAAGDEAFLPPVEIEGQAVFLVERLRAGRWQAEAGARLEHRGFDTAAARRSFDLASLSASASYELGEGVWMGLTAARTERAPTEIELFADGPHLATAAYERGDPDLAVETATSLEATVRWRRDALSGEASLWTSGFDGFIAFLPQGTQEDDLPVFAARQADAELTGGEVSVRYDLPGDGAIGWSLTGSADWVRGSFSGGGALPRMPPPLLTLGAEAAADRWSARAEVQHGLSQDRVAAFELPTDGWTSLNLRLVWRAVPGPQGMDVVLEGHNLTDAEIREHVSFLKDLLPRPGRSLRLAVRARF